MFKDFELFFASLLTGCVEIEGFYETLQLLDINPEVWPDCPAKTPAILFFKLAKRSGERAAAVITQKNIEKLEKLNKSILEIDERFIAANYHGYLEFGRSVQLGRKILSDPKSTASLIHEYTQATKSDVGVVDIRAYADDFLAAVIDSREKKNDIVKIPGFEETAKAFGGFNPGCLWVITAGTGVGKTNLSLNMALRSSQAQPTLFINMEMRLYDINLRIMQIICAQDRRSIFKSDSESFGCSVNSYTASITEFTDL